jgi:phenylacetate-CoA ligase
MYHLLLRKGIFPVMETFKGTRILRDLAFLEGSQWWTPGEMEEYRRRRLRALIRHVYTRVPYYRRIFRERGLTDGDIRTTADLGKLPFLTKEEIRTHFSELQAAGLRDYQPLLNSTSGSTGEPLRYYTSLPSISMLWASGFRAWEWAGYRLGDRYVTLGGSSLVPTTMSLEKHLRYRLERNLPFSSLTMNEDTLGAYAGQIRRYQPLFLRGWPSSLYILARFFREHDLEIGPLKGIFTTAETLLPSQRATLEEVFSCRVFDQYGCRDGAAGAMECGEHSGYHMVSEQSCMELIRDGGAAGPGEWGEIVSTDLENYAMPFIRYRTGDTAVGGGGTCPCGRGLPLLRSIEGRLINLVARADGSLISGLLLTDEFEHIALEQAGTIEQFQILQDAGGRVRVRIVKGPGYAQEHSDRITASLKERLGETTEVALEFVPSIPPTRTGKHLYVISDLRAR